MIEKRACGTEWLGTNSERDKKKVPNLVQGSLAPMGGKLSSAEFIESPFKVLTKRLMKRSETPENFCI